MSFLAKKIKYDVAMATLADSCKSCWVEDFVATEQALFKEETEFNSE